MPLTKEQFRGKTHYLAAIRLAHVRARNRASEGHPDSLKPLILLDFLPVLWYNETIKNGTKNMPRSAKDIQLTELKDTISKLNKLTVTQTKSMDSLHKTIGGAALGVKQQAG